ncbi:hypothetical protein GL218_07948 [Daldinia childiae]|uniref:uncharacterized protein n=1 Tax=Daldinia childiae TaxID=326645 RepID=UPI0014477550|nr:uncharacterized protein GL218_07948 [Daldinia childiae]KAF3069655.1 hypothetical protein GL218_07948 [Daldinia childiae]
MPRPLRSSCDRCHSQKLKCPKQPGVSTCTRCLKADATCIFSPAGLSTRRALPASNFTYLNSDLDMNMQFDWPPLEFENTLVTPPEVPQESLRDQQVPDQPVEQSEPASQDPRSTCVKRLPEIIIARCNGRSAKNEDYDSDEEDLRNGVPTTYSQHRGGQFTPDMKTTVAERHDELICRKSELQGELYTAKQRYLDARDWFINASNPQWDAKKCFKYRQLEDNYVDLTRYAPQLRGKRIRADGGAEKRELGYEHAPFSHMDVVEC